MLNNILALVNGDGSSWAGQERSPDKLYFDNWGEPLLYALIGFLIVFVGISIIIFIIWLLGLIMRKTDNLEFLTKKRENKVKNQAESVQPAQSAQDNLTTDCDEIPDEVKAAIMAAIMAYYEEKQEKCQFTVKRIKRL